jgi:ankyrin repeat protein
VSHKNASVSPNAQREKLHVPTGMPKKTSKRQSVRGADGTDDDFDRMLAEVMAADPELPDADHTQTETTNSNASASVSGDRSSGRNSSSSSSSQASPTTETTVSDEAIIDACTRGNLTQLRQWGRQGIRVQSAEPLICAVFDRAQTDVLRCLVNSLGADVNLARANGVTAVYIAAESGFLAVMRCLVKELGADAHQVADDGGTPLYIAAQMGHVSVVRCLVKDFGVHVDQARHDGTIPLYIAAQNGHLNVVRCLVKEFGANVNQATQESFTPLMVAAESKFETVVEFLIKYGARLQTAAPTVGTAADVSKRSGAPVEQMAYLEARTHCAHPGCSGAGVKKCAGYLKVYYCARECQLAHWSAHKRECRYSEAMTTSKTK